uniref:Uncharacterized protein n=1 Tax=Oryza brachyantha TaxID=4533 RepID=J3N7W6_ORYBR
MRCTLLLVLTLILIFILPMVATILEASLIRLQTKGGCRNTQVVSSVNGGHEGDLYDECTLMRNDLMVQNYYTQVPNSSSTTQDGDFMVLPGVFTTLMHHSMAR